MARSEVINFIKRVSHGSLALTLVANKAFRTQAVGDEAAEQLEDNTADIVLSLTYLADAK